MARRSNPELTLWLVIGALLLIFMIPKEIWISLGVVTSVVLTILVAIKRFGPKAHSSNKTPRPDPPPYEPTLADLLAREENSKRKRSAINSTSVQSEPEASESTSWSDKRDQIAKDNRERTLALRASLPSYTSAASGPSLNPPPAPELESYNSEPEASESISWSDKRDQIAKDNRERTLALRASLPSYTSAASGPSLSPPPAPEMVSYEEACSPNIADFSRHSEHWLEERQAAANANRQRTEDLRSKLAGRASPDWMASATAKPFVEERETFYVSPNSSAPSLPSAHTLPPAPAGVTETRWLHADETIEIAGTILSGGLVYVGPNLKAPNGITEPALINPNLTVSGQGDCRDQHTNYSPSYANLSPGGRRAYLHWLSTGRSNPDCDIGLVFLFFYGLERRVIVDSQNDSAAKEEWPTLMAELRRLLEIYGSRSESFKRYAGDLLSWIELDGASQRLYEQPVPDFPRTYELPPYLRLALGQASIDRKPVPAGLALSWVRLSPEIYLRTPATRCPDEFGRLFAHRYQDIFGTGLVLPKNRTRLKFSYRPASLGLIGVNVSLGFGDIPDVTALTAPIKKLAEIVEQSTNELAAYSRLIGKDPGTGGTLEGLLLLPTEAWPDAAKAKLETLGARVSEGCVSLLLSELLDSLGGTKLPMSRERFRNLARTLEGAGIGLEPDVLAGAKAPAEQETVVLFQQPALEKVGAPRAEYQTAALTLQLASAMAHADGEFHARELAHLQAEIEGWAHLSLAERRRLNAHLKWLNISPISLAALKKKLEPLPTPTREILATFMATLAQSDGFVSPEEVRFLEKIYKTLGVEPKRVFSDIHAAEAGRAPISISSVERQGFRLDAQRIAALQEDTARVSALLSSIFVEEASSSSPQSVPALELEPEVDVEPESNVSPEATLGLDESHAALLRLLLSRSTWTRAELEDAAADLDLMLDGALEQINEAAFDAFEEPLIEGDDPITVNVYLIEAIEA